MCQRSASEFLWWRTHPCPWLSLSVTEVLKVTHQFQYFTLWAGNSTLDLSVSSGWRRRTTGTSQGSRSVNSQCLSNEYLLIISSIQICTSLCDILMSMSSPRLNVSTDSHFCSQDSRFGFAL